MAGMDILEDEMESDDDGEVMTPAEVLNKLEKVWEISKNRR